MHGRRLGGVIAAGLGIALVLLLLLHRPEEQQRPAPQAAAKPPPPAPLPVSAPIPEKKTAAPRAVVARTNPPAQPPPPAREPPRQPPADPAVPVEPPPVAAKPEKPDSVFGWGPWAGPPQPSGGETPTTGENTNPSGVLPSVNVAANAGGSTPPPALPSSNDNSRPGHGWGDRNHSHVHRRDR